MKRFGMFALAMCLTIAVGARDPRDNEIRQLKAVVKAQKLQITQLRHELALAKEGKPLPVASRPAPRVRPAPAPKPMRPFKNPLKVGMVGYVTHVQVLWVAKTGDDMLALIPLASRTQRTRRERGRVVGWWDTDVARVWIKGIDVSEAKKGDIIDIGRRMKIVGRERLGEMGVSTPLFFQLNLLPES